MCDLGLFFNKIASLDNKLLNMDKELNLSIKIWYFLLPKFISNNNIFLWISENYTHITNIIDDFDGKNDN